MRQAYVTSPNQLRNLNNSDDIKYTLYDLPYVKALDYLLS